MRSPENAREIGSQILGKTIAEIQSVGIAAHIRERQNGDGGPVQRRTGRRPNRCLTGAQQKEGGGHDNGQRQPYNDGPSSAEPMLCSGHRGRRVEPIAPAGYGTDAIPGTRPQCPADVRNTLNEAVVGHRGYAPHGVDQGVLGNRPIRDSGQVRPAHRPTAGAAQRAGLLHRAIPAVQDRTRKHPATAPPAISSKFRADFGTSACAISNSCPACRTTASPGYRRPWQLGRPLPWRTLQGDRRAGREAGCTALSASIAYFQPASKRRGCRWDRTQ